MSNCDDVSVYNYGKICRTCLAEGVLKDIYEVCDEKICLIEMLMSISFVQIAEKDGLPSQICLNCENEVIRAYKFAQRCLENENKLRNSLKTFEAKTLIKNNKNGAKTDDSSLKIPPKARRKSVNKKPELEIQEAKPEVEDVQIKIADKQEDSVESLEIKVEPVNYSDDNLDNNDNQSADNSSEEEEEEEENSKPETNLPKRKKRPNYECKKCNEKFPNYQLLRLHRQEKKHPARNYAKKVCNICHKTVGYSQMNQHMRIHTMEKPYVCDVCGRKFSLNCNLRRHMMQHTGERPHRCHVCNKGFIQSVSLKEHLRVHSGEHPFICSYCGKSFTQNGQLRAHLRRHEEETGEETQSSADLFPCDVCNRKYTSKAILKTHKLIHGEKSFLCSVCGRGFVSKAGLQSHSKVHTGVRPYSCETCNKSFGQLGTLKSHILTHTGERPFICKICSKGFTQRNHLKYHMRVHSGERPYSCTVCGKSFSLNGTLTVHMRIHTGETPYVCSVCGKGFYDSSSMKKHRKGHGINLS